MMRNTSSILTEKYIDKIKKDEEMNHGRQNVNNSVAMKTAFDNYDNTINETNKIKETIEVFSHRYYQIPKKKITANSEIEDEADESDALSIKDENLAKLKSPIRMNKNIVKEEEKKSTSDPAETKGTNTFTFFFHGLSIFFINDYKDNFYPVLCLSLKETNYMKENRIDGSFVSQSQLDASFDYYNIKNGYWEPFIEGLDIEFQYDRQLESSVIQIKGKESINLNISPDFVAVLNYCFKSWEQAQKDLKLTNSARGSLKDVQDMFSEEVKSEFEEEIRTKERISLFNLYGDDDVVDIATPYKIRNLTGMNIFVETLFEGKKEKYILHDNQTTKIAISYEKQTSKSYEGVNSKMNDNVKIQFQGLYLPIHKISLNKLGQHIHKLTEDDEENDFIYYETKVVDMNKVLTLRTRNLLINSTQFSYIVVIKNPENKAEDKKYTIRPGESVSFPKELES